MDLTRVDVRADESTLAHLIVTQVVNCYVVIRLRTNGE